MELEYRKSDYFNTEDLYVFETGLNNLFISSVFFFNGFWYSEKGCKYKMTTVRCINYKELHHKEVKLKGVDYKGKICKALTSPSNDIGIMWNSGEQVKKHGLANFWQNVNNIEICHSQHQNI